MLNADAIHAEAEEQVGIADSDGVKDNLGHLVDALNAESGMSEDGFARTHANLVRTIVQRLDGLKWLRDHPEIADEPIETPVFLMGLPRSGTTYFQYLFDRDPRYRLIRTWESLSPSPPPGADPESARRRKAEWAAIRAATRPSFEGFDALHLIDEDGSDECHAFMEQSFGAAGLNNLYRVPTYFDFIMDGLDLTEAYRIHKRQLQLLQWRSPTRPWALKYPNHVIAMREILEVYPDARFVMTHRDPVQTLASIAKMSANLRAMRTAQPVDPHQVGRDMLHFIQRHIDRIMAFDRTEASRRVVHVDYYEALQDPGRAMRAVHEGLGIDSPCEVVEAVDAWRTANPKNARGRNDYNLDQYGLDDRAVAEQFGDYMRRFDIPREREGLARVGAPA